jgi:hypothetical protein
MKQQTRENYEMLELRKNFWFMIKTTLPFLIIILTVGCASTSGSSSKSDRAQFQQSAYQLNCRQLATLEHRVANDMRSEQNKLDSDSSDNVFGALANNIVRQRVRDFKFMADVIFRAQIQKSC